MTLKMFEDHFSKKKKNFKIKINFKNVPYHFGQKTEKFVFGKIRILTVKLLYVLEFQNARRI